MELKEKPQSFGLKKEYDYIDKSPEENIFKILNWLQKYGNKTVAHQADVIAQHMSDPITTGIV